MSYKIHEQRISADNDYQLFLEQLQSFYQRKSGQPYSKEASYNALWKRIGRIFPVSQFPEPDDFISKTIDRIVELASKGEIIEDFEKVAFVCAKWVVKEYAREKVKLLSFDGFQNEDADQTTYARYEARLSADQTSSDLDGENRENQSRCYQKCLDGLPEKVKQLFLEYYPSQRLEIREKLEIKGISNEEWEKLSEKAKNRFVKYYLSQNPKSAVIDIQSLPEEIRNPFGEISGQKSAVFGGYNQIIVKESVYREIKFGKEINNTQRQITYWRNEKLDPCVTGCVQSKESGSFFLNVLNKWKNLVGEKPKPRANLIEYKKLVRELKTEIMQILQSSAPQSALEIKRQLSPDKIRVEQTFHTALEQLELERKVEKFDEGMKTKYKLGKSTAED